MDALQALARRPHDRLHRLGVALIGTLHLLQHGNPAVQPPCLHGELLHPLVGLLFLGHALLQTQPVTCHGVVQVAELFLCRLPLGLIFIQSGLGSLDALLRRQELAF